MLDRDKVRELYLEVSELPESERASTLERRCAGDAALRAEVESLLNAAAERPEFMSDPTVGMDGRGSGGDGPGARIGPYKLLEEIGHGGFGTVYMAEQESPVRRRVALKIIKLGMDTKAVIRRFEVERQALAMMDHPHIAKVLDAGATASGRPFFVMELVQGVPITDYADKASLSIEERLNLFIQVCHAVQHAHMKGVIHRDIKPGNVLVTTQDGRPYATVIDFGIAKATEARLTQRTLFTEFRQLIGTPEYMSPEQAGGAPDVDSRSDVYSLGVLLYELLTGATPFDPSTLRAAAYDEIQRIIREVDPPKPSTRLSKLDRVADVAALRRTEPARLNSMVTGDLDWIVMKALDKDRARRYESPSALASDIASHLTQNPVRAAPPSWGYRGRKFVRRHRVFVTAVVTVGLSLVLGLFGTFAGLLKANAARAAEESLRKSAQESALIAQQQAARAEAAEKVAQQSRERAEYEGYLANIEAAYGAMRLHDTPKMSSRLSSCLPEQRNWEWHYLNSASDNSLVVLEHGGSDVQSAAYSADGLRIVSRTKDGVVFLWSATSNELIKKAAGPSWVLGNVGFNQDGTRVFAAGRDGRIFVWDATTMTKTAELEGAPDPSLGTSFLAGERLGAGFGDGTARVWDLTGGKEPLVLRGHSGPILDFAASPRGDRFATASQDQSVRVWTVGSEAGPLVLQGHKGAVRRARWSPDQSRLVTACDDGFIRVWDAATGQELSRFRHDAEGWTASFSPDGARVLSASMTGELKIWEAATGHELRTLRGHTNIVWGAMFSADGSAVLTHSADNTIRLWNAETGVETSCYLGHLKNPLMALYSPDGSRIISFGDSSIRLWDSGRLPQGSLLSPPPPGNQIVQFSPDLQTVLESGAAGLRLINAATGEVKSLAPSAQVSVAAFSPDGSVVLCALDDATVKGWEVKSGRPILALAGHSKHVNDIRFRPDGGQVLTASEDGTARQWDPKTGKSLSVLSGSGKGLASAGYDPGGKRIVTAGTDGTVQLWSAESGTLIRTVTEFPAAASSACFSPDGTRILSTSRDYTARVSLVATGETLFTLKGHHHVLYDGIFSNDGSRIVTCGQDDTVRFWDASNGRPVLSIAGRGGGIGSVRFSLDGSRLILMNGVDAWELDSLSVRERFADRSRSAVGQR